MLRNNLLAERGFCSFLLLFLDVKQRFVAQSRCYTPVALLEYA